MPFDPTLGASLVQASRNPQALARMAATAGIVPPTGGAAGGGGLASILEPLSGVARTARPALPSLDMPSAPGVPSGGGAIPQESQMMQLMMDRISPQRRQMGPRVSSLAQILGR
jgi:hypothetical protein